MSDDNNTKGIFGKILNKLVKKIETGIINAIENAEISQETDENGEPRFSLSIQIGNKQKEIGNISVVRENDGPNLTLIPADNSLEIRENPSVIGNSEKTDGDADDLPVIRMPLSEAIRVEEERENAEKQHAVLSKADTSVENACVAEVSDSSLSAATHIDEAEDGVISENAEEIVDAEKLDVAKDDASGENILAFSDKQNENLENEEMQNNKNTENCSADGDNVNNTELVLLDSSDEIDENVQKEANSVDIKGANEALYLLDENAENWAALLSRLDPDRVCDLSVSAYANNILMDLLESLWDEVEIDGNMTRHHISLLCDAMKLSDILTFRNIYSRFQTVCTFQNCFDSCRESDEKGWLDGRKVLYETLRAIGGNGLSFKQFDDAIYYDIFEDDESSVNDELMLRLRKNLFSTVMTDLRVERKSFRYHPGIYHYSAWISEHAEYWEFVRCIEGLMRFQQIQIPDEVACDENDSVDGWLCSWSKLPQMNECSILCVRRDDRVSNEVIISVMPEFDARKVWSIFEKYEMNRQLSCWVSGENIFGLTMI